MSDLLKKVTDYYLSSADFNGLPIYQIDGYDPSEMRLLIESGYIEALYNSVNPHIKHFNKAESIENQVVHADGKHQDVCFYPTPLALEQIKKEETKPYTKLLQSGYGQYEVRYFEVEVLEQYFNDPKYIIFDSGYRGSISIRDEYEDGDMIQDYGMAYPKSYLAGGELDRAVAVFVHDLAQLSEKSQMKWKSREIDNQEAWIVNGGFIKNLVLGQWVDTSWIYTNLLKEQVIINEICDAIGINHIFSQTWNGDDYWGRPEGYRTILFPTRKNYYEFVTVLEKITCNNISTKAFTKQQLNTKAVIHEKDEGSIALLGKWLKENGMNESAVDDAIVAPLKKVRKIRQTPAHEVVNNEYDKSVYKEQNELIEEVFCSINELRIMLSRHPLAATVKIPDYLDDLQKIAIY